MPSDCIPLPTMSECEQQECRHSDRISVMRPVELRTSDGWEIVAQCTDVNASGIGVDSDWTLKVGQRVELRLKSREGKPLQVPMMVIYRMGTHYGLSALASREDVLELLPLNA